MKNRTRPLVLAPHIIWCVLFIIVPMLFVLYFTFTNAAGEFTLSNFKQILNPANNYIASFVYSIIYALAATVICLLIGYPIALYISRLSERKRQLLILLIMLPMWVSFIIRTFTILNIFEDNGIINQFLKWISNDPKYTYIRFTGTPGLIIFGMVYDFLPYMILPICNVLSGIDKKYLEAASDLGCNSGRVFTKVLFPLSISGVISGITMVFVPAISTFYIASTLSGGTVTLIGDKIERAFIEESNQNVGAALSFVLMLMILVCMFLMNKFGDSESEDIPV